MRFQYYLGIALISLCVACTHVTGHDSKAVITTVDDKDIAFLQKQLKKSLGLSDVKLSRKMFSDSPFLVLERTYSNTQLSHNNVIKLELFKDRRGCYVQASKKDDKWYLAHSKCRTI